MPVAGQCTSLMHLLSKNFHKTIGTVNYTNYISYDAENYSIGLSSNGPNLSEFILSTSILKSHIHIFIMLPTCLQICKDSTKNCRVVDFTLQCKKAVKID